MFNAHYSMLPIKIREDNSWLFHRVHFSSENVPVTPITREHKKVGCIFYLKFHRFKVTKVCSGYGLKIILIGFALFIANPHKIATGRKHSLNEKINNFS